MSAVTSAPSTPAPAREGSARKYAGYFLFVLCCSLYLLPFMRIFLQKIDEGMPIYGAVRIVHGQVFARDFTEIAGPGTFYCLAMFFKTFGINFLATRIYLFVISLGTGFLMYFLSRRMCARYRILPCLLLAGMYFGMLWPTVSYHVDCNFFALLSVASIIVWQDTRKNVFLLAAGGLAGATTFVLQTTGILLLLALLLWLAIERKRGTASLSAFGMVAGGYIGVTGLVLTYFQSQHALWALIYQNLLWPVTHYSGANTVPYAQNIVLGYWDIWTAGVMKWAAPLLILPFILVAALPALLLVLCDRRTRTAMRPEIVLYWLCGWALWLGEIHRKDICHLVFGSSLLLILCIHYLERYRTKVAAIALQILSISAACLACFNLFVVLAARPEATRVGRVAVLGVDPVLKVLDDHVAPGEEIFSYPYYPMYYFLSGTTNPTRYSYLVYGSNSPAQFKEVVRVLEEHRVKYVVWNANFVEKTAKVLFPAKDMRPDGLIVEPYLESHYRVVWERNGYRLMERKSEAGHS